MTAAFPALLVAGAALAVLPLVLHLLRRSPPERAPLPTARFLSADPRTRLRMRRRPTDRLLMVLRMGLALALGAALADVSWTRDRTTDVHVVLLDAGADSLASWDAMKDAARRAGTVGSGERGVVLAYGLPDGARLIDSAELERVERGPAPAAAHDGLQALRSAVKSSAWHEVRVSWVTQPRWDRWSRGIGLLRPALWPGRTPIVSGTGEASSPGAAADGEAGAWSLPPLRAHVTEPARDGPLARALEALGAETVTADLNNELDGAWVFRDAPTASDFETALAQAAEGATVVLSGDLSAVASGRESLPWAAFGGRTDAPSPRRLVLPEHLRVAGPSARFDGLPAEGARVVAVYDDATPAAATRAVGRGCLVYFGAEIVDPELAADVNYPSLIATLGGACRGTVGAAAPLDERARAALERPDLPERVAASAVGESGVPLTPWLVGLALLLLLADVGVSRRGRP